MYRNETLRSVFTLYYTVSLFGGMDRNIFFLALGLNLGLLSFPSFPKQSIVIYWTVRSVPYLVKDIVYNLVCTRFYS